MKTPLLDELESRTKYSYLRKWIIGELGEEPIEFSTLNPDDSEIMRDILKFNKFKSSHSTEGGRYYYVLRGHEDSDVRMVAYYIPDDDGLAKDTIMWMRPSDLNIIVGEEDLLDLMLKEF